MYFFILYYSLTYIKQQHPYLIHFNLKKKVHFALTWYLSSSKGPDLRGWSSKQNRFRSYWKVFTLKLKWGGGVEPAAVKIAVWKENSRSRSTQPAKAIHSNNGKPFYLQLVWLHCLDTPQVRCWRGRCRKVPASWWSSSPPLELISSKMVVSLTCPGPHLLVAQLAEATDTATSWVLLQWQQLLFSKEITLQQSGEIQLQIFLQPLICRWAVCGCFTC